MFSRIRRRVHDKRSPDEITLLLLVRATYVWCCSSRTFCSWWTAHSAQRQWRGCNTPFLWLKNQDALEQWFSNCGTRTTSGTRGLFMWYASSFPVILKSFVNSFLCYNSFVCYANVANSFICYINLKYILSKLRSSETRGVHSNIKKTSGGTRSQNVWEPVV